MPEMFTVSRKVPIYAEVTGGGKLQPFAPHRELEPHTKVDVVANSTMWAAGLPYFWCYVISGLQAGTTKGYIPRYAVQSGYVSQIVTAEKVEFTGVKYGASKTTAGASRATSSGDISTVAKVTTGSGAQYTSPSEAPDTAKVDYHELLMANQATCPRCGRDRGDHKLLETTQARDLVLEFHAEFRSKGVGGAFMMGVLTAMTPGRKDRDTTSTWFAMSDAAPKAAEQAAKNFCTKKSITLVRRKNVDEGRFLNFEGEEIDHPEVPLAEALGCAAPKLLQYVLQKSARQPLLFLSEIWYKAGTAHALYSDAATIDSCDRCRLAIPPMLCGYKNPFKKKTVGRPTGWVSVGQLVKDTF